MFSVTNREKEKGCYNMELYPEGEVNSGGYIPRRLSIERRKSAFFYAFPNLSDNKLFCL